jgi:hypothetical protein
MIELTKIAVFGHNRDLGPGSVASESTKMVKSSTWKVELQEASLCKQ